MGTLNELKAKFEAGNIHQANKVDLEKYVVALCDEKAGQTIGGQKYPQMCETVRLLLFKQYLEEINTKNGKLQNLVIMLSIAAVFCSIVQIVVSIVTAAK